MVRYRSFADGFTLLETLVALALLGAVVVVGLESIGVGASARKRAADYAELRLLAEGKLEAAAIRFAQDREGLLGVTKGGFEAPFENANWRLEIREEETGSGLFVLDLEVRTPDASLGLVTYVNRFAELWSERRAGR